MTPRSKRLAPDALAQLTELRPVIQGYALAITADHQLAEDAYQEVAAVVSADPDAMPSGDEALPWLREVARRKALELGRSERRDRRVLSDGILDSLATDFAPRGEGGELATRLARCVEQLAAEHRRILAGRYDEKLTAEEIAHRAGRSVQGVYAVLKRVRRALARCMRGGMAPGAEPWNEVLS